MKETDNDGSYKTTSSLLTSPAFASSADGPQNNVVVSLSMSVSVKSGSQCRMRAVNDANGLLNMQHCSDSGTSIKALPGVTHCITGDMDSKPTNSNNHRNQQADCTSIHDVDLVVESTRPLSEVSSRDCSGSSEQQARALQSEKSSNAVTFPSVPTESSTDEHTDRDKTTVVVHMAKTEAVLDVRKREGSEAGNGKLNSVRELCASTQNESQKMANMREPIGKLHNSKKEIVTTRCKEVAARSKTTKKAEPGRNDVQPQPSTSASAGGSRNRLTIQPRTTQYEKHALLQTRQDSGMSELEEFFLEKDQLRASNMLEEGALSNEVSKASGRLQLQPRGAQCEKSPLLVKNKSGLSELEIYLLEKDVEASKKSSAKEISATSVHAEATSERRQRLQPRSSQYEENSLLEERDAKGMSAIEQFLNEKEDELTERGRKCGANSVCKSATCPTCRPQNTTEPSDGMQPQLSSSKRVHFKQRSSGSIEVQLDGKGAKSANQKSKSQGNPSRTTRWRQSLHLPRQHSKLGDMDSKTENNRNRIQSQKSCTVS